MAGHPLAEWLDGDEQDSDGPEAAEEASSPLRGRRRLVLLVAAATVPWIALALVLALPRSEPDEASDTASVPPAGDPGDAAPTAPPAADGAPGLSAEVPAEHSAIAVVGTRLEVSRLAEEAGRSRYVDVAVAEGAERVGDVLIISVLAVVLEGADGAWTNAGIERFAVPVAASPSGDPALAGPPWPLPAPADARTGGPDWSDSDEPDPDVAEALAAAGFEEVADLVTARDGESALLRASFTAQVPPGRHEVWITEDPQTRVLGLRARDRHDMKGGH